MKYMPNLIKSHRLLDYSKLIKQDLEKSIWRLSKLMGSIWNLAKFLYFTTGPNYTSNIF